LGEGAVDGFAQKACVVVVVDDDGDGEHGGEVLTGLTRLTGFFDPLIDPTVSSF
jgi:hypothetical protein